MARMSSIRRTSVSGYRRPGSSCKFAAWTQGGRQASPGTGFDVPGPRRPRSPGATGINPETADTINARPVRLIHRVALPRGTRSCGRSALLSRLGRRTVAANEVAMGTIEPSQLNQLRPFLVQPRD
jgi:hypothetical protein